MTGNLGTFVLKLTLPPPCKWKEGTQLLISPLRRKRKGEICWQHYGLTASCQETRFRPAFHGTQMRMVAQLEIAEISCWERPEKAAVGATACESYRENADAGETSGERLQAGECNRI